MFKVGDRVWLKEQKKVAEISLITKPHSTQYYMKDMQGFWFEDEITQTAQTMFEALGYEKSKVPVPNQFITLEKINNDKNRKYITFDLTNKTHIIGEMYPKVPSAIPSWCNADELKAINQMCIELGWIE